MSRIEQGRFCESCEKSVRDFSTFSDQQLRDFFSTSTGKICGSFTKSQVDRFNCVQSNSVNRRRVPQLLISAALTVGMGSNIQAKDVINQISEIQSETTSQHSSEQKAFSTPPKDSLNYISGKIIDYEDQESIPFVNISIKGTNYTTSSDEDGKFKLFVPDNLAQLEITLIFSYLGYEEKEIQASTYDLPFKTVVRLHSSLERLTGDVLVTKRLTLWQKIFKKKEKTHVCR